MGELEVSSDANQHCATGELQGFMHVETLAQECVVCALFTVSRNVALTEATW